MILLPAIDILDGKAVRLTQGDFDQRTVYDADPLDAARRWVDAGARGCTSSIWTARARGAPVNLEHVGRIARRRRCAGPGRRRPAHDRGGSARRSTPGRPGSCSGPPPTPTSTSSTRRSPSIGDRVVVSVDARGGMLAAAGLDRADRDPGRGGDRAARQPRRAALRLLEHRPGRHARRAPTSTAPAASPRRVRGSFIYSGGVVLAGGPARAGRAAPGQPAGVIVGKALYERPRSARRATAQAVLDGRQ